jgi:hypothetical protein
MLRTILMLSTAFLAVQVPASAPAQGPDRAAMDAQRAAMARLAWMDGVWRGPATTRMPNGQHRVTQTERIGTMLDGSIRVMEGKAFNQDGSVGFNAFAILSFDPVRGAYRLHSHTGGRVGDFALEPSAKGYVWTIPIEGAAIRYTATFEGETWTEIGERVVGDRPPQRFFEMHLRRVGDTSWPAGDGPLPE